MGLKTITRKDLALRGKEWTKKAPQAVPNKKEAASLAARQSGYRQLMERNNKATVGAFTMPGSYRK